MSGTLKLDLALYREMAAFSSFGFDESTQELLRRGAELTEMLKQQQFRPLPPEVQVLVLFNGIKERITSKQIKFYEYQVIPNLIYGLKNGNRLTQNNQPFKYNPTTLSLLLTCVTESLIKNEKTAQAKSSKEFFKLEHKKFNIEKTLDAQADYLCTYYNLVTGQAQPHQTYIYNLSFLLIRIALKYGFITQKANREIDAIFNVLGTFNIGS